MKTKFIKTLAVVVLSAGMYVSANAQWSAVGSTTFSPGPAAICPFNGDLYIANSFSGVEKWNGTTWTNAGVSTTQPVLAMASFDSVLYVATYNAIYQVLSTGSVSNIATLNDPCYALCFWNHVLYAGGWMDSIGPKGSKYKVGHIAQYSGGKWDSIPVEVDYWPFAMTIYNGMLAVGGEFNYSAAGDTLYGVGLWDGTKWHPCKHGITGNGVYAIGTYNGNLIIGGGFDSATHVFCKNIAQWNGTTWGPVGTGQSGTVYAMTNFNNALVAGGYYDSINSWNGSAWTSLGAMPMYSEVQALTVYNGNLYAGGGQLTSIGGATISGIGEYTLPAGITEVTSSNGVMVYPNPNNGQFTIQLSINSSRSSVEVYNILGEKVFTAPLNPPVMGTSSTTTISLPNGEGRGGAAAGIYLYRILTEDGNLITTGRVVVK